MELQSLALQDAFLLDTLPADQRTVGLARANGIPTPSPARSRPRTTSGSADELT